MPNHCINGLMIEGKPKEIHRLLKKVQVKEEDLSDTGDGVTPLSFQKIIPRPKSKNKDSRNWNIENWGTKWDCYEIEHYGDWEEGYMGMTFTTAWSPPIPVIDKLATQYKELNFTFTFYELGNNFCGLYNYKEGVKEVKYDGTIDEGKCEVLDEIMGTNHHWCGNCGNYVDCEGIPVLLCEECSEIEKEIVEQEEQLWDKETEKTSVS